MASLLINPKSKVAPLFWMNDSEDSYSWRRQWSRQGGSLTAACAVLAQRKKEKPNKLEFISNKSQVNVSHYEKGIRSGGCGLVHLRPHGFCLWSTGELFEFFTCGSEANTSKQLGWIDTHRPVMLVLWESCMVKFLSIYLSIYLIT